MRVYHARQRLNVGETCGCLDCQAAGVTHLRRVRVPPDEYCSRPRWLHGAELRTWHAERDAALAAARVQLRRRTEMPMHRNVKIVDGVVFTQITPGFYQDPVGDVHLVLDELLAAHAIPDTAEARALLVKTATEEFKRHWPDVTIETWLD
jgi:hypothetical protein